MRDLPIALAARGWRPTVLTPAYGRFARTPGAKRADEVEVAFSGSRRVVGLYELPSAGTNVRYCVLDHALFEPRGRSLIYTDDASEGPFATDAGKFAFFCAAAAVTLGDGVLAPPDIVHLHDWQTGMFLVLREFDPACVLLKKIRTVFTIHNIAMQGIRPLSGHDSSLATWFPRLEVQEKAVSDPRWTDCINPMAAAIRLADGLNTVSPTYAREVLQPAVPARGYFGGEGLEQDLQEASNSGRFTGILNGCNYPAGRSPKAGWGQLLEVMRAEKSGWIASQHDLASTHYIADKRIAALPSLRPDVLVTSVGRIAAQKTQLFREPTPGHASALEDILTRIGPAGLFIMVGSGDPAYERFLAEIAATRENFLFLNGYSETLALHLYGSGDLFLMPSTFEPCGISQMLAMRDGQLCVVHGVGGLRDTVTDGTTGFVFAGRTPAEQANHFAATVGQALELRRSSAGRWRQMQKAAMSMRFTWEASAAAYETGLYEIASA